MRKTPPKFQTFSLLYLFSIGYLWWYNVVFHPRRGSTTPTASRYLPLQTEGTAASLTNSTTAQSEPTQQQQQVTTSKHLPNYFTELVPWESLVARSNTVSVYTGCSIATWTFSLSMPAMQTWDDCGYYSAEKGWKGREKGKHITNETLFLIKSKDSIYVELMKLDSFASRVLPYIKVDFVLISGQSHLAPARPEPLKPPYLESTFDSITNNPHVTHWFMMNLDKHAYEPFHPKLHPFPYGLSHAAKGSRKPANFNPNAKNSYLAELRQNRTKEKFIFVGFISKYSNHNRARVPRGKKLPPDEYYKAMHESRYILSPDGDRPECYRHYEAIGLGAKPITQLHPYLYRHLQGNVVFNVTKWNVRELETILPQDPKVNRRLLYEEYWMEHVERVVGCPMRWWDPSRETRSSLSEISAAVTSGISQTKTTNVESR